MPNEPPIGWISTTEHKGFYGVILRFCSQEAEAGVSEVDEQPEQHDGALPAGQTNSIQDQVSVTLPLNL